MGEMGFGNSSGSSVLAFEPEKPEGPHKRARAVGGLKCSSGARGRGDGKEIACRQSLVYSETM